MKAVIEIGGVHGPYTVKAVNDFITEELAKVERKRQENATVGLVDMRLDACEDLLRSASFAGDGSVVQFCATGPDDTVKEAAYYLHYAANKKQFATRERVAA